MTNMEDKKRICSFCGRELKDEEPLIIGNNGTMCMQCLELAEQFHKNITVEQKKSFELDKVPTPKEIKDFLDEYVIGQDKTKERIAVAVYNHYKRISTKTFDDVEIEKSNILLLGNTGTGKTYIARTIAKMLNVPFTIADATTLTESGYVGEDVETIITRLLQAADFDVERAEKGIIFIDEIDKIARKGGNASITRDVSGEGVQQGLLKLLEGSVVNVAPNGGRKHPDQKYIQVNTKDILFICGGAFEGIEKRIEARLNRRSIGYNTIQKARMDETENILSKVSPVDLKSFGLIPELIGRLPIITYTNSLDEKALRRILTEPKNALVKQYQKLFEMDGTKLVIDESVYPYIVKKTVNNKLGARGLRGVMEDLMQKAMFDNPSNKKDEVHITLKYAKRQLEDEYREAA